MAKMQTFYMWFESKERKWCVGWKNWFTWHVHDYFYDQDGGYMKAVEALKSLGAGNRPSQCRVLDKRGNQSASWGYKEYTSIRQFSEEPRGHYLRR
jgi:hypothetical protein